MFIAQASVWVRVARFDSILLSNERASRARRKRRLQEEAWVSSLAQESHSSVVIKIGGSVLTDAAAYKRAAEFVRCRVREANHARFVIVVSAENGLTDQLLASAQRAVHRPNPVMLDLLWATGELRSVALLAFHLHAVGVRAIGLNVHQSGLIFGREPGAVVESVQFEPRRITRALERFRAVVAPGFLATRRSGSIVSLGRGGSDFTAVLLAAGLRAERCELIKDVPGYFTEDPAKNAGAAHLPQVTYERARAMARAGCDLVQPQALEFAARRQLRVVVRSLDATMPQTEILPALDCNDAPRRAPEPAAPISFDHLTEENYERTLA